MAIITRTAKGSPLTTAELDNNFTELNGRLDELPEPAALEERLIDIEQATVFELGSRDNVADANAYLVANGLIAIKGMRFFNIETGTLWIYDAGWEDTQIAVSVGTENTIDYTPADSDNTNGFFKTLLTAGKLKIRQALDRIVLYFRLMIGLRVYSPEMFGAVGDGTADDGAAINLAIAAAGVGGTVRFQSAVYATTVTISNSNDGQYWIGQMGGNMFSSGRTQGTVLKWIGASNGKLAYFGCSTGGSNDLLGGGISGVTFDGNSLAATCLHLRSCNFSSFKQIKGMYPNSTGGLGILMDSDVQARAGGANSMYRCNFYNTAIFVEGTARGMFLTGASDETGGRHPAFCSIHGLHIRHHNGDALIMESADDILVEDFGVSKVAGGTGRGIFLKGKTGPTPAATYVAGCTFMQITVGSNDTPKVTIDGINVKGICFYGVQGVDASPTLELLNGAIKPIWDFPGSLANGLSDSRRISPGLELFNIASSNNETLDFYRERTFTPGVVFGGAAVGITYSTAVGRATRVGDVVHFVIQINLSAKGSSTGVVQITSLPYAVSTSPSLSTVNVRLGVMNSGLTQYIQARISTTNIFIEKLVAGAVVGIPDSDFSATSTIWLSGIYFTDSTSA